TMFHTFCHHGSTMTSSDSFRASASSASSAPVASVFTTTSFSANEGFWTGSHESSRGLAHVHRTRLGEWSVLGQSGDIAAALDHTIDGHCVERGRDSDSTVDRALERAFN